MLGTPEKFDHYQEVRSKLPKDLEKHFLPRFALPSVALGSRNSLIGHRPQYNRVMDESIITQMTGMGGAAAEFRNGLQSRRAEEGPSEASVRENQHQHQNSNPFLVIGATVENPYQGNEVFGRRETAGQRGQSNEGSAYSSRDRIP